MTFEGVIFDLDGVLVPAGEWHYQALIEALAIFGVTIPADEHARIYDGLPTRTKLSILSARTGFPLQLHPVVESLKQRYTMQLIEENCHPDPAKLELFEYLRMKRLSIGLFSNSIRASVETMLRRAALLPFFDCIISNEDVSRPKPHPEGYLLACEMLRLPPTAAVAVEDSVPGRQAARAAGLEVIEVVSPLDVTLDSIVPQLHGLPMSRAIYA